MTLLLSPIKVNNGNYIASFEFLFRDTEKLRINIKL